MRHALPQPTLLLSSLFGAALYLSLLAAPATALAQTPPAASGPPSSAPPAVSAAAAAPAVPAATEKPEAEKPQTAGKPDTDEAQRIFEAYGDAVYQVQTIDVTSGKKSSIGSGFQFTKDGLLATNYHVISTAVQRPAGNRLEYLHEKEPPVRIKVLIADVVNDLAILKMDHPGNTWVELGKSTLPKGAELFSLGNPHDIGLSILPGTFNGNSHEGFVDKIHFSGALNPGMSGGPVLGHDGKVIGVNEATAGNQIGFLVPVEHLRDLLLEYLRQDSKYDFVAHADGLIESELLAGQKSNVDRILGAKWESVGFGPVMVPGRITEAFKCWGEPNQSEKNPYSIFQQTCLSQDREFVDEDSGAGEGEFYTGFYQYGYDYVLGKPEMNLSRFYSLYESRYAHLGGDNNAGETNVTNFDCDNSFLDLAGKRWKASFCVRKYKKYPKLYDMRLYLALVGEGLQGLIATANAEGVSMDSALKLAHRFMAEIRPRPAEEAGDAGAGAGEKK